MEAPLVAVQLGPPLEKRVPLSVVYVQPCLRLLQRGADLNFAGNRQGALNGRHVRQLKRGRRVRAILMAGRTRPDARDGGAGGWLRLDSPGRGNASEDQAEAGQGTCEGRSARTRHRSILSEHNKEPGC